MAQPYGGGGARRRPRPKLLVVFDLGSSHVPRLSSVELEAPRGVVELKEVRCGGGLVGNRVRKLGRTLLSRQLHTILAPFDAGTGPERVDGWLGFASAPWSTGGVAGGGRSGDLQW